MLVLALITAIYVFRLYLESIGGWESEYSSYIASTCNAIQITLMNYIYSKVAVHLTGTQLHKNTSTPTLTHQHTHFTDKENYQTSTHYEDALISKLFCFQ